MSKLNDLIKELCPDGVEYKRVDDVCRISRGRVMSKSYIASNEGEYPVYSSQTENEGILGTICTFDYDGEYLTWTTDGANAGSVFYRNGKFSITNVCGLLDVQDDVVNTKFLYYVLVVVAPKFVNKGMGNPKLMSNVMGRISIPVPPLPVQCEIVRILDNFTALTSALTSALTAELTAQRKRYSGLLNSLLSFEGRGAQDGVLWKKLGDIATEIYRGAGIKRDEVTEKGIQCVRYGEIYTSYNIWFDTCISHTIENKIASKKYFEKGDILFAITGESVEEIAKSCAYVGDEKCLAGGDIVVMKHKQNPKYLAYALATTNAQMQKSKGKVKSKVVHSSVPAIKEIVIPIPSLEEQQRIVDILDRFDKLCNDLSEGLPAEIAARQKQYEYYRDKLLTFKEKEA